MKLWFIKGLAFYLGCVGCYLLQRQLGFSAVLSSALLGFLCTFIPLPRDFERKGIHAAFFAGTFAGMSSALILTDHYRVLLVSVVGTTIYFALKPRLVGFGGKMGAVAFLSSMLAVLLKVFA